MKKMFLLLALVTMIGLSSCTTISNNSYVETVDTEIYNRTAADLVVGDKYVSYTLKCNWAQSRAGENSCKAAAIQACLQENGGGDILVNPQFEVKKKWSGMGKKIEYVKVSGRIGKYKNFHPATEQEVEIVNSLKGKK